LAECCEFPWAKGIPPCCKEWADTNTGEIACPQHRDQRLMDSRYLGYEYTSRRIKAGMFNHLSVN
jgi:hypothetical protein